MAAYSELRALYPNDSMRNKVEVACVIAARAIMVGTTPIPTAGQVAYARSVLENPSREGLIVWAYVIAANSAATTAQILGATDAQIQAQVDAAMAVLKGA